MWKFYLLFLIKKKKIREGVIWFELKWLEEKINNVHDSKLYDIVQNDQMTQSVCKVSVLCTYFSLIKHLFSYVVSFLVEIKMEKSMNWIFIVGWFLPALGGLDGSITGGGRSSVMYLRKLTEKWRKQMEHYGTNLNLQNRKMKTQVFLHILCKWAGALPYGLQNIL